MRKKSDSQRSNKGRAADCNWFCWLVIAHQQNQLHDLNFSPPTVAKLVMSIVFLCWKNHYDVHFSIFSTYRLLCLCFGTVIADGMTFPARGIAWRQQFYTSVDWGICASMNAERSIRSLSKTIGCASPRDVSHHRRARMQRSHRTKRYINFVSLSQCNNTNDKQQRKDAT